MGCPRSAGSFSDGYRKHPGDPYDLVLFYISPNTNSPQNPLNPFEIRLKSVDSEHNRIILDTHNYARMFHTYFTSPSSESLAEYA
jgi:hypothetical protein